MSFPKSSRILKSSDFRKVYDQGTRMTCPSFAAFYLPTPLPELASLITATHFGFTTPRALGKAVIRNRIRRRMREAVRLEHHRFPVNSSIVFNPRKLVLDVPFETLRQEVVKMAGRCKT